MRQRSEQPPFEETPGKSPEYYRHHVRQNFRHNRHPATKSSCRWRHRPNVRATCGLPLQKPAADRSRYAPRHLPKPSDPDIPEPEELVCCANCRVSNFVPFYSPEFTGSKASLGLKGRLIKTIAGKYQCDCASPLGLRGVVKGVALHQASQPTGFRKRNTGTGQAQEALWKNRAGPMRLQQIVKEQLLFR